MTLRAPLTALGARERQLAAAITNTNEVQRALGSISSPLRRAGFIGLCWLLLTIVADGLAVPAFDVLETRGTRIGFALDPVGILQEFVVFPLLIGYFFWAPLALVRALAVLDVAGVIAIRHEDIDWLTRQLGGRLVRGGLVLVALLFAGLLYATYALSPLHALLWLGEERMALVKLPFWFAQSYAGAYLITWVIAATALLARVFDDERDVHVEILHPDGCGGLRPLSNYVLALAWFIGLVGATIVLGERNWFFNNGLFDKQVALPVHAMVVAYVGASLGAFFAPLFAPHRRMARAKAQTLAQIGERFRVIEQDALTSVEAGTGLGIRDAAAELEAVRAIYSVVYAFPVWPLDVRILRGFAVAALGQPLLALAFDLVKSRALLLLR